MIMFKCWEVKLDYIIFNLTTSHYLLPVFTIIYSADPTEKTVFKTWDLNEEQHSIMVFKNTVVTK